MMTDLHQTYKKQATERFLTITRRSASISRRDGVYFGASNPDNLVRGAYIK